MFRVFLHNKLKSSDEAHTALLCQSFDTLKGAQREAETHLLSDASYYIVKEYPDRAVNIIGPDEQDTGTVVFDSRVL